MILGITATVLLSLCIIYLLNMQGMVVISVAFFPDIQKFLNWAFNNLRLSMIPFLLFFLLYLKDLLELKKILKNNTTPLVQVSQKEHLVDIWINIFFGVGVIWTAIGMRGALMNGLGNLNAATAASQGAFTILERLVNGGILLALSTTIFGGVGGYLMRVGKAFVLGYELRSFYNAAADVESETVLGTLERIEHHLSILSHGVSDAVSGAVSGGESGGVSGSKKTKNSMKKAEDYDFPSG